ncbi:MAG: histidinol dehydrogenase, partial [Clostridia bacterium]|nr:histidinol dehydrogenase [Clostridia bacterium]
MLKKYRADDLPVFFSRLNEKRNSAETDVTKTVLQIIEDVKQNGDKALKKYTEKFDGVSQESFEIPTEKAKAALEKSRIKAPLLAAAENIREYHKKQIAHGFKTESEDGCVIGRRVLPLERVGIYV